MTDAEVLTADRELALLRELIQAASSGPGVEPLAAAAARMITAATGTDVCFVHVLDDTGGDGQPLGQRRSAEQMHQHGQLRIRLLQMQQFLAGKPVDDGRQFGDDIGGAGAFAMAAAWARRAGSAVPMAFWYAASSSLDFQPASFCPLSEIMVLLAKKTTESLVPQ